MAEFLDTQGVSLRLSEIITNAQERLYLVSPYLQINPLLKERIEDRVHRSKIDIRVIYREINPKQLEEKEWLESMTSIKTSVRKNLHAKCYLNEKEALLTSMNLYQFSQEHNDEMGILVSVDHDRELYDKIYGDVWRIIRVSEEIRVNGARVEATENGRENAESARTRKEAAPVLQAPEKGYCIRCKVDLPVNPTQLEPHCRGCKASWNRFKNEEYEENYCHTCGKEHTTTKAKPVCRTCHRKYKDVLEFAAG